MHICVRRARIPSGLMARHHTNQHTARIKQAMACFDSGLCDPSEDAQARRTERARTKRDAAVEKRKELEAALWAAGERKFAAVLAACGEEMALVCVGCGTPKVVQKGCRKRWCPVCAPKLAAAKVARYSAYVERMRWPLFLTLTIPNEADLKTMFNRLRGAWKRFRRTKWWRACQVAGGVSAFEVTNKGKGWHVHLHAIIDCKWLAVHAAAPQRGDSVEIVARRCAAAKWELTEAWTQCVGVEATITYVARTNPGTVREALKYSVTPDDLIASGGDAGTIIRMMTGARLTIPFGSMHGLAAEVRALENEEGPGCQCDECGGGSWLPAGVIDSMVRRVQERDPVGLARRRARHAAGG